MAMLLPIESATYWRVVPSGKVADLIPTGDGASVLPNAVGSFIYQVKEIDFP